MHYIHQPRYDPAAKKRLLDGLISWHMKDDLFRIGNTQVFEKRTKLSKIKCMCVLVKRWCSQPVHAFYTIFLSFYFLGLLFRKMYVIYAFHHLQPSLAVLTFTKYYISNVLHYSQLFLKTTVITSTACTWPVEVGEVLQWLLWCSLFWYTNCHWPRQTGIAVLRNWNQLWRLFNFWTLQSFRSSITELF